MLELPCTSVFISSGSDFPFTLYRKLGTTDSSRGRDYYLVRIAMW